MAKSPWLRYLSLLLSLERNSLLLAMTDCQLAVIKDLLLNSEKRKATYLLLFDLNIVLGLQESIAFKSSTVTEALNILTSLMQSAINSICLSLRIESKGFSVSAIGGTAFIENSVFVICFCTSCSSCGCISVCVLSSFFFRKYAKYLSNTTVLTTTEK